MGVNVNLFVNILDEMEMIKINAGGDLVTASYDIIKGLPDNKVVIGFHNTGNYLRIYKSPFFAKQNLSMILYF